MSDTMSTRVAVRYAAEKQASIVWGPTTTLGEFAEQWIRYILSEVQKVLVGFVPRGTTWEIYSQHPAKYLQATFPDDKSYQIGMSFMEGGVLEVSTQEVGQSGFFGPEITLLRVSHQHYIDVYPAKIVWRIVPAVKKHWGI